MDDLVRQAAHRQEIEALLLGLPPYDSAFESCAHGETSEVWERVCRLSTIDPVVQKDLKALFDRVRNFKEFVLLGGTFLAVECQRRARGELSVPVDLDRLAQQLRDAIRGNAFALVCERRGIGAYWSDGMLGELWKMSRIAAEYGHEFMPIELLGYPKDHASFVTKIKVPIRGRFSLLSMLATVLAAGLVLPVFIFLVDTWIMGRFQVFSPVGIIFVSVGLVCVGFVVFVFIFLEKRRRLLDGDVMVVRKRKGLLD